MKVLSFARNGVELFPVEVEVTLMPGLPQIKIMGLPDTMIKESAHRIRSALRKQGFQLPRKSQVLVNLRPANVKKVSCGLDLAIAYAYLRETDQVPNGFEQGKSPYVYGELGLDGQVLAPEDLDSLYRYEDDRPILTGFVANNQFPNVLAVDSLKSLEQPVSLPADESSLKSQRPEDLDVSFPPAVARLIELVASGEHSVLLAGPAGAGKSTVAEAIHRVLKDPDEDSFRQIQQVSRLMGEVSSWRPLVSPHHTIPPMSMIGGGSPPFPGEITRSHGGVLLLDEFLEFHLQVKEALREPIEKGEITVSRRGRIVRYPAQFLLVGTTNLCPCGDLLPGRRVQCRFSLVKCRSYLERLSGPLLDRFEILGLAKKAWWEPRSVDLSEVRRRVDEAQSFAESHRGQCFANARLTLKDLEKNMDLFMLENLIPDTAKSQRRRLALFRVARTLADLDGSPEIGVSHLNEAIEWAVAPFVDLQELHS